MQFYSPDTIYLHTPIATIKTKRRLTRVPSREPYGVVTDTPPISALPQRSLKEKFCPAMQVVHAQYRLKNPYRPWRNAECPAFMGSLNKSKETLLPSIHLSFSIRGNLSMKDASCTVEENNTTIEDHESP